MTATWMPAGNHTVEVGIECPTGSSVAMTSHTGALAATLVVLGA